MVYYDDLYGGVLEGDGNNGSGGIEDLVGGNGITLAGGTITADVAAVGYRMELNGGTASVARYMPIESVSGNSVTMLAGHAYKIYATSAAITLNTEAIPANSFGLEGHLEIFVSGTGYVQTGSNVVLANALEPDAVNNCTVRFHDGLAIISVEDHVAGYIVTVNASSGAGSLAYGLATATNEYISIDASLNGQTLDLAGAVTNGEKHVVGNGYTETIVSGGINCTSKTTFSNLGMDGVIVSSGTLTLGDVQIPSGATVAVSGGGLAVEKVTGAGSESVIDFGGTRLSYFPLNCVLSSVKIINAGNSSINGGLTFTTYGHNFNSCEITSNSSYIGVLRIEKLGSDYTQVPPVFNDCYIHDNVCPGGGVMWVANSATATIRGGTITDSIVMQTSGTVSIDDTLHFKSTISGGSVTISSGAIVDLTGNTNATPIAPGGGITFESGGATVLYDHDSNGSAMASSASYMMDNVTLPAGAKLTNTAVVDLGGTNVTVVSASAYASGCTFTNGVTSTQGGVAYIVNASATFLDCVFSGNSATNYGGAVRVIKEGGSAASCYMSNCEITGCTAHHGGAFSVSTAPSTLDACYIHNNSGTWNAAVVAHPGAKLYLNDCRIYDNTVAVSDIYTEGTGQIIVSGGTLGAMNMNNASGYIELNGNVIVKRINGSGTVTISSGASINLTSSIAPGGGIQVVGGTCTVNGNVIEPDTYTSIDSTGTPT